jgi:hypothetical protein
MPAAPGLLNSGADFACLPMRLAFGVTWSGIAVETRGLVADVLPDLPWRSC